MSIDINDVCSVVKFRGNENVTSREVEVGDRTNAF